VVCKGPIGNNRIDVVPFVVIDVIIEVFGNTHININVTKGLKQQFNFSPNVMGDRITLIVRTGMSDKDLPTIVAFIVSNFSDVPHG
jgi:hypothetical protein